MAECPFIDRSIEWDGAHLEAVDHPLGDGLTYLFYRLYPEHAAATSCQFCQHIGRKYDVFECLNNWQWKRCPHYMQNRHTLDPVEHAELLSEPLF